MALYVWPPQSIAVNSGPLEVLVDGVATQVDYDTGTPANSVPVPVYVVSPAGGSTLDFGSSAAAARTAAQIGNATGAADFNAGNASAQTLRTVIATDQSALPITAAALPLPTGAATEATLALLEAKDFATETTLALLEGKDFATETTLASVLAAVTPVLDSTQTQTVDDTAGGVTFTAPAGARTMIIQNSLVAGGAVRFVAAADTPTASDGYYLGVGQSTATLPAGSFKAIAVAASEDGDVTVVWGV